jgi:heterodisulfide reductase subunit A
MKKILILGGGLAGSVVADKLSECGIQTVVIEKKSVPGGKVREYGCKADDECSNCGMCLVKNLFTRIKSDKNIDLKLNSKVLDVYGSKGNFKVLYSENREEKKLDNISDIVVATGFKDTENLDYYGLSMPVNDRIIRGNEMEAIMRNRGIDKVFPKAPEKLAFIQCFGSRDKSNSTNYCSRVCCGYSTRMSRVIRKYYPDVTIDMYCMDVQEVEKGKYLELLKDKSINMIKSRPVMIEGQSDSEKLLIRAEAESKKKNDIYDYIILSDGIIANPENEYLAEILGLHMNKNGFLEEVELPEKSGLYISGCAKMPMGIEETFNMSEGIAQKIYLGTV